MLRTALGVLVQTVQTARAVETSIDLRSHLTSCLQILLQRYRDELARTARELAPKIEEIVAALRELDEREPMRNCPELD